MATDTARGQETQKLTRYIMLGGIAGLIGGVAFGILMAMMNMLPMVAMLVRSESAVVGFIVHLVISAGIGASFGLLLTFLPIRGRAPTVVVGAVYGAIWWVLGALVLMPLMLGMNEMVLQIGEMQWYSLMGHLIYGVVAGIAFTVLDRRA